MKWGHIYVKVIEEDVLDQTTLEDGGLLKLIQQGSEEALEVLIERHKRFVWAKAHTYFLIGGDREDVIQEGMIGLFKAVRDFDPDKPSSFKGFAELCITRQIITAIKAATRQKHIPLNSYISLHKPVYDEESERTLLDIIAESRSVDPQELLISQEKQTIIEHTLLNMLSPLERRVLYLYVEGRSYVEISEVIHREEKTIDNALQRVKKKLEKLVQLKELNF